MPAYAGDYFERRSTMKRGVGNVLRRDTLPPLDPPDTEQRELTAAECERLPFLAGLSGHDPERLASYEWWTP